MSFKNFRSAGPVLSRRLRRALGDIEDDARRGAKQLIAEMGRYFQIPAEPVVVDSQLVGFEVLEH